MFENGKWVSIISSMFIDNIKINKLNTKFRQNQTINADFASETTFLEDSTPPPIKGISGVRIQLIFELTRNILRDASKFNLNGTKNSTL